MNWHRGRIYFDYAASTPVDPEVFSAMKPYFGERFANAGSLHRMGDEAYNALHESRKTVADFFGAEPRGVIFTASATEANNLAMRGVMDAWLQEHAVPLGVRPRPAPAAGRVSLSAPRLRRPVGDQARGASESLLETPRVPVFPLPHIVTTAIEHESVLAVCRELEKRGAATVTYVEVNKDGIVRPEDIKKALRPETVLVSVMYANNEIGTIQPIAEIANIIRDFRITQLPVTNYPIFHTDAAQAVQFLDCDIRKLGVDMLTASSHKIYGPKGAAALCVKKLETDQRGIPLIPIMFGGGQEYGLRPGTENIPAIVGFAKALELIKKRGRTDAKRIGKLRDELLRGILRISKNVRVNGSLKFRLPNNLNLAFPDIPAEILLVKLDQAGVAVSLGSACEARAGKPSHVLRAIDLDKRLIRSSIRISLGRYTNLTEIRQALKIFKSVI